MAGTGIRMEEVDSGSEKYRRFFVLIGDADIMVTVTFTPSVVRRWIRSALYNARRHRHQLVVGLGVQWVPDGRGAATNPAATLQLCLGRRCLVFQLQHAERVPLLLRRFLLNRDNVFVGMWNQLDKLKLSMSRHALEVPRLVDLRRYAVTKGGDALATSSMEEIVKEYLGFEGVKLERYVSMSQWDEERLRDQQVQQASCDAYACFEVGRKMKIWNKI